jgi:hypothetical protein
LWLTDWHFRDVSHYEMFNVTADPRQLRNLYYSWAPPEFKAELHVRLQRRHVRMMHAGCRRRLCCGTRALPWAGSREAGGAGGGGGDAARRRHADGARRVEGGG